jgi:hypothetical protein
VAFERHVYSLDCAPAQRYECNLNFREVDRPNGGQPKIAEASANGVWRLNADTEQASLPPDLRDSFFTGLRPAGQSDIYAQQESHYDYDDYHDSDRSRLDRRRWAGCCLATSQPAAHPDSHKETHESSRH